MARVKKITSTKISGIMGDISSVLLKYSSDKYEIDWVKSEIKTVLELAVDKKKKPDFPEELSGVVDPRNIA